MAESKSKKPAAKSKASAPKSTRSKRPSQDGIRKGRTAPKTATTETTGAQATPEKPKAVATHDVPEGAAGEEPTAPADGLLEKLKKGVAEAYKAGTRVVDDFSHSARDYTERIKAEAEIKDLSEQRDRLAAELGRCVYAHHHSTGQLTASFFKAKETGTVLKKIEKIEKLIDVMQKQLKAMNA